MAGRGISSRYSQHAQPDRSRVAPAGDAPAGCDRSGRLFQGRSGQQAGRDLLGGGRTSCRRRRRATYALDTGALADGPHALAVAGVGVEMLRLNPYTATESARRSVRWRKAPVPGLLLVAVCIGVLSGLLANGGGLLLVPAFVLLFGASMREAAATSLICVALGARLSVWQRQVHLRRPFGGFLLLFATCFLGNM